MKVLLTLLKLASFVKFIKPGWQKLLLILLIFSVLSSLAIAQTKVWDKTYGGTLTLHGRTEDSGHSILKAMVATPDGGYLLAGSSDSERGNDKSEDNSTFGDRRQRYDIWIVRIDANGNKQWDRTISSSSFDDAFNSELFSTIITTPDGGYLLGGSYSVLEETDDDIYAHLDYWIIKLDSNGNTIWDKTFGGSGSDVIRTIIPTVEGGYLLGGTSDSGISGDKSEASKGSSDYWVVKIDGNGNKVWDKTYGGSSSDNLQTILPTSGGYLLGGNSNSGGSGDKSEEKTGYWAVKIDGNGVKAWDKVFSGNGQLITMPGGGYLLAGSSAENKGGDKSEDSRGDSDYWVVRVDENGARIWDRTFGGNKWDNLNSAVITPDGYILLGGTSNSGMGGEKSEASKGGNDYWIVKIDGSGTKVWDRTLGGYSDDVFSSALVSLDGNYLLGGTSESGIGGDKSEHDKGYPGDYWIIKVKEEGTPPPVSTWNKGYGGKSFERLTSVVKTSDGGYLLGGHSLSRNGGDRTQDTQGRYDYWIVKTDAAGSKLWEQSYGGSDDDYLNQIIATADGGYLLAGSSQSGISGDKTTASRGNQDFWIIKIDANGNKLWDKSYGGSGFEDLMQAVQLSTGEYVLAGVSASDMGGEKSQNRRGSRDYWLLKVSATGQKLWDQRYGGSKAEELGSLVVTADGGFILGGSSLSGKSGDKTSTGKGNRDYWIVRTDGQGTQLWDKSYGGAGEDVLSAMNITTAGVLLLAGHSTSGVSGDKSSVSRGSSDYWLIKTNAQGIKQWDKTYGGNAEEELGSLISTQDGGWLIGGSSFSNQSGEKSQNSQGSSDYWVVKLEEDGEQQWDQTYGGAGEERLRYLLQTEDQGYLLAGFSFSDESGDKSQDSQGRSDYWIVKIPPTPATTEITASTVRKEAVPNTKAAFEAEAAKLGAYPVPFNDNITFSFSLPEQQQVRLELYNSQGEPVQLLFEGEVKAHQQYKVQWRPAKQESNGLYFLQLKSNKYIKQTTILLSR